MRVLCLTLPLTFLTALACSSPRGGELFSKDGLASAATGNVGGSLGASAGTDSAGSQNPNTGGTLESFGGSSGSGSGSAAGSADKSGGPPGGSGGSGGQEPHQPPVIESCDMLEGAVTSDNGHCYRVNSDLLTFVAARDACRAAGGYLVAISSEAEDDFVHGLLEADHWLGASDGRSDDSEGVGSYTWLSGDDWDYTSWETGQPNAVATNCPNEDSGANCFEHCAYQDESGGWIDRACWHTIASVCEWEPQAKPSPVLEP